MGIDLSKIPTKTINLSGTNLAAVKGLFAGLVLVEALGQVSIVIQFDNAKKAKDFFAKFAAVDLGDKSAVCHGGQVR